VYLFIEGDVYFYQIYGLFSLPFCSLAQYSEYGILIASQRGDPGSSPGQCV
jgi:hypothetical protein